MRRGAGQRRAAAAPPAAFRLKIGMLHVNCPAPFCCCCAEDAALQQLCELWQQQFVVACDVADLERGRGDQRRLGLLPKLRAGLAAVNAQLSEQQQQQQPAVSAGQGSGR